MSDGLVIEQLTALAGGRKFRLEFRVEHVMVFDLDLQLQLFDAQSGEESVSVHIRQAGWDVAWLPRGSYTAEVDLAGVRIPDGAQRVCMLVWDEANGTPGLLAETTLSDNVTPDAADPGQIAPANWSLQSNDGVPIGDLSWNRGHEDWFFKHFDHAARVIVHLMLDSDERLKGRILDVGCGDGMTDLGVFLRCQPEEFVGIDPSRRYELLPEVADKNHIPEDWQNNPALRFEPHDGNAIPYEDDYFDVVLSWGSLEHIAGGYAGTLSEIRRVLKPGGLLFVHPGLFYGAYGNHLGEFFDDPWVHLKLPPDELRERVLGSRPEYMDRGGEFATPEEYWQWYTELNPITVTDFEKELRELGFEPWRVAVRTSPLVEYTPELQQYGFEQLANREVYVSARNRK